MKVELKDFIGEMLTQIRGIKRKYPDKVYYLIDEIEFELTITEVKEHDGKVNVYIGSIGGNKKMEHTQKIKIKLIPGTNNSSGSHKYK